MKDEYTPIGLIVFLASAFVIGAIAAGCALTQLRCDDLWRDQLAKSGHAEYYLDANNQRQWRMKEAK